MLNPFNRGLRQLLSSQDVSWYRIRKEPIKARVTHIHSCSQEKYNKTNNKKSNVLALIWCWVLYFEFNVKQVVISSSLLNWKSNFIFFFILNASYILRVVTLLKLIFYSKKFYADFLYMNCCSCYVHTPPYELYVYPSISFHNGRNMSRHTLRTWFCHLRSIVT